MARSTAEIAARCSRSSVTCRCRSDSSMWNCVLAPARRPRPRYRLSAGSWGSHFKGSGAQFAINCFRPATSRDDAAIQSLSERSGHSASRAYITWIYGVRAL